MRHFFSGYQPEDRLPPYSRIIFFFSSSFVDGIRGVQILDQQRMLDLSSSARKEDGESSRILLCIIRRKAQLADPRTSFARDRLSRFFGSSRRAMQPGTEFVQDEYRLFRPPNRGHICSSSRQRF